MLPPRSVAYSDEILREVADRMASLELGVLPVLDRNDNHLHGVLNQFHLMRARQKLLLEERHAERALRLRRMRGDERRKPAR